MQDERLAPHRIDRMIQKTCLGVRLQTTTIKPHGNPGILGKSTFMHFELIIRDGLFWADKANSVDKISFSIFIR